MDCHVHSELQMVLASIGTVISLLLMAALSPSLSQSLPTNNNSLCSHPYKCGELELYYPFRGRDRPRQCGGHDKLRLFCTEENDGYNWQTKRNYTYIGTGSQRFNVVGNEDPFNNYYWVKLMPLPVADGGFDVCSGDSGYSLDYPLLMYDQRVHNITIFYDCSHLSPGDRNLGCGGSGDVYYDGTGKEVLESHQNCHHHIQVPAEAVVLKGDGGDDASILHFGEGVVVNYTFSQDCQRCGESGGSCGSNDTHPFTCYCPDGSNALQCSHPPVPAPDPPPGPPPDNRSQQKSMSFTVPTFLSASISS